MISNIILIIVCHKVFKNIGSYLSSFPSKRVNVTRTSSHSSVNMRTIATTALLVISYAKFGNQVNVDDNGPTNAALVICPSGDKKSD